MRVIFLDFDGVLNNHNMPPDYYMNPIDPAFVPVLNEIVEKSGAKVVISSAWRLDGLGINTCRLRSKGFNGHIIGVTPSFSVLGPNRGHEIQEWLDNHQRDALHMDDIVTDFCILDDSQDMAHLMHKLVWCHPKVGLQPGHVEEALKMMGCAQSSDVQPPGPTPA